MSVLRPRPPEDPLAVESLAPADVPATACEGLTAALAAVLTAGSGGDPLTASLLDVELLLAEYGITRSHARRRESRLFAILATARAIAADTDRVILLGDPATLAGPRLLLASCAHPWHDHLARGDRGGRPRLLFVTPHHDPDAIGALLDLLVPPGQGSGSDRDLLDRAALVVVGQPATAPTADIIHLLGPAVGERVFHTGTMATDAVGSGGGPASVLGTPGLLAAALAGIDVVRLLVGAAALVARCRSAAGPAPVATLATALGGTPPPVRGLVTWAAALAPLGDWYWELLAAAAHPGGLRRTDGAGIPGGGRCLAVSGGEPRRDLPRGMAARGGWRAAAAADTEAGVERLRAAGATGAVVRLPRIDEHAIGQLLALLLLATVVERGDAAPPRRCDGGVPGL